MDSKRIRKSCPIIVSLLMAMLLVGGCSSLPKQTTMVNYYPQCYEPINYLRESDKQLMQKAVGGALLGGAIGAIGAAAAGGKGVTVVAAGVGGAVAGGLAGYYLGKQQQIKDDTARFASYNQDMKNDISTMDRQLTSTKQAQECYNRQFQALLGDYKEKKIDKTMAQARFKEIYDGLAELETISATLASSAKETAEKYQLAMKQEPLAANIVSSPPMPTEPQYETVVAAKIDNIRKEASAKSPVIGKTSKGQEFFLKEITNKWYHVATPPCDGCTPIDGYIHASVFQSQPKPKPEPVPGQIPSDTQVNFTQVNKSASDMMSMPTLLGENKRNICGMAMEMADCPATKS